MRIKQLIIHSNFNFSKMKNKILPTRLQEKYSDNLGEVIQLHVLP